MKEEQERFGPRHEMSALGSDSHESLEQKTSDEHVKARTDVLFACVS